MKTARSIHPHAAPTATASHGVLQRTCTCGGSAGPTGECAECRRKRRLQPKLTVTPPGDRYEREADRVAEQVMRMPDPAAENAALRIQRLSDTDTLHRQAEEEEEEMLQTKRKPGRAALAGTEAPPLVHDVLRAPGRPLDGETKGFMESRFGHDFSQVRVHTGGPAAASAQSVGARAYTVGRNVVFGSGAYAPGTMQGRKLLAHELTHVMQQTAPRPLQRKPAGGAPRPTTNQAPAGSLQRVTIQTAGTGPDFGGGDRLVPVPDEHLDRVRAAVGIVSRVVDNPDTFPRCPRFFRDNCPGGTDNTLSDVASRAQLWFNEGAPSNRGGVRARGTDHIGYTALTFRIGRWAMAASLIHELMHVCGQPDHDVGDQAKDACGRLPDIIQVSPRIEISNPIR